MEGSSYQGGPFQRMQLRITDVTADQLAHLDSDPPVVVPAPGLGKALAYMGAFSQSVDGTIPFDDIAGDIHYDGIPGDSLNGQGLQFGPSSSGADRFTMGGFSSNTFDGTLVENAAFRLGGGGSPDEDNGALLTIAVSAGGGGLGYSLDDTFSIVESVSPFTGIAKVTGVGALGVVTDIEIVTPGYGYAVATGVGTLVITGAGDGNLTVDITDITPATGTGRLWVYYAVLDLP